MDSPSSFPHPLDAVRLFWQYQPILKQFGPTASASPWFDNGLFGRDGARVGFDGLPWDFSQPRRILVTMTHFLGDRDDPKTEEEPGKDIHEYRHADEQGRLRDGFRLVTDPDQLKLYRQLLEEFGGFPYYGSIDATCEAIRLAHGYWRLYGPGILEERVLHKSGEVISIADGIRLRAQWISGKLATSDLGLFEFQSRNRAGHDLHVWRENQSNYLHLNGEYANVHSPVGSIEAQGIAYDGLTMSSEMLGPSNETGRWLDQAADLRSQTLRLFWMPERQYFGQFVDRDPENGEPRLSEVISLLPAELLETRLFDDLPDREMYVSGVVRMVCSEEFMTEIGPRMQSVEHYDIVPFIGYQNQTVWPKAVGVFANGLRRQGLEVLATNQEHRIMNFASLSGRPYEFGFVDRDGRANYDLHEERPFRGQREELIVAGIPEGLQAWTIKRLIAAWTRRSFPPPHGEAFESLPTEPWLEALEQEALGRIGFTELLTARAEVQSAFPTHYAFHCNSEEGWRRWRRFVTEEIGSTMVGREDGEVL